MNKVHFVWMEMYNGYDCVSVCVCVCVLVPIQGVPAVSESWLWHFHPVHCITLLLLCGRTGFYHPCSFADRRQPTTFTNTQTQVYKPAHEHTHRHTLPHTHTQQRANLSVCDYVVSPVGFKPQWYALSPTISCQHFTLIRINFTDDV